MLTGCWLQFNLRLLISWYATVTYEASLTAWQMVKVNVGKILGDFSLLNTSATRTHHKLHERITLLSIKSGINYTVDSRLFQGYVTELNYTR
jgi:hypothetical protein